ncbi:MAG: hypothetical protein M0R06_05585 [Sphaerochaeta sp.]|jgi:hypothetical protein|nr:hypothetical protein [Sphaerochaeta sp.]
MSQTELITVTCNRCRKTHRVSRTDMLGWKTITFVGLQTRLLCPDCQTQVVMDIDGYRRRCEQG